jgi:hypothetical protein
MQPVAKVRMVSVAAVAHGALHRIIIADLLQESSLHGEVGFIRLPETPAGGLFVKRELQLVADFRPSAGQRSASQF